MSYVSANDPRLFGATDSETIQNAIGFAKEQGVEKVLIPRANERTGCDLWIIDSAILLPDHITVELDGAHLRLADGVTVGKVVSLFRGNKIPVSGLHLLEEIPDELALGSPGLPSIYTYYLNQ